MHWQNKNELAAPDIWAYVRAHWMRMAFIPIASLAAGLALIVVSEPIYRSEAVLAPVGDEEAGMTLGKLPGQVGNLASLVGIPLPTGSPAATHVATLRSKALLAQFIQDENLVPELFADDWDEGSHGWLVEEPPTLEDAVMRMDEDVRTVFEDKESGIVVLRVEWRDRQRAAAWAQEIADRANAALRSAAIAEAKSSMEYLQRELQKTNVVELQNAIFRLMESQTQKIMIANVRPEYAFRIVDPPRVPEDDEHVWPNAPLIVSISLLVGVSLVFMLAAASARPRS